MGRVQTWLNQVVEQYHLPGISVGIKLKFKPVWILSAGFAKLEAGLQLHANSRFRVVSLSKVLAAIVTLKLVEQSRLDLDTPIDCWLDFLPYAERITIRHLLQHRSGLFSFNNGADFDRLSRTGRVWSPWELLDAVRYDNHYFEPGSDWYYSNSNYTALGLILEQVCSRPLAQIFREMLLDPLGMGETFQDDGFIPASCVDGHLFDRNDPQCSQAATNYWHISTGWACGAMVSTSADLLKLSQALFSAQILSPESLKQMRKCWPLSGDKFPGYPSTRGYGLGLMELEISDRRLLGHIGNNPSFSAILAYSRVTGSHFNILLNQGYRRGPNREAMVEYLAAQLMQLLFSAEKLAYSLW